MTSETTEWRRERWAAASDADRAWWRRVLGDATLSAWLAGDDCSHVVWRVRLGGDAERSPRLRVDRDESASVGVRA